MHSLVFEFVVYGSAVNVKWPAISVKDRLTVEGRPMVDPMVSTVAWSRPTEVVGKGSSGSKPRSSTDQVSKRALAFHLGSYWVPVGNCHSLFSSSLVSLVSLNLTGTAGYSFRVVICSVSYWIERVHVVSSKMVVAKALLVVGIGWVGVAWMGHRLRINIAGLVVPRAQGWWVVVAMAKGRR